MGHWHPLTWISHMIDISLFGLNPVGHHAVNLALHSLNTLGVFFLLRKLSFHQNLALLGALFFGLHPMRLESIAWVTERKDVLSFFFGILSLLIYLNSKWRVTHIFRWRLGCLLFFVLSLLAKPTFISLPILFALIEFYAPREDQNVDPFQTLVPFFLISLFFGLIVLTAQDHSGALKTISLGARLEGFIISLGAYFGKFLLPFEASIFYPYQAFPPGIASGMAMGLGAMTVFCFRARKQHAGVWLGWLWFLITSLPVSGLVQIGGQIYADRWTMLPHLGLLIGALALLQPVFALSYRWRLAGTASIVLCGTITSAHIPHWQNSETVFRNALALNPKNFMAHTNLGSYLDSKERLDEAAQHYEEVARLEPDYAEGLNNFGSLLARRGNPGEAISYFERAIARDPGLSSARYNLALSYYSTGRTYAGLQNWLQLLARDPHYPRTIESIDYALSHSFRDCEKNSNEAKAFETEWIFLKTKLVNTPIAKQNRIAERVQAVIDCMPASALAGDAR